MEQSPSGITVTDNLELLMEVQRQGPQRLNTFSYLTVNVAFDVVHERREYSKVGHLVALLHLQGIVVLGGIGLDRK